MVLLAALANAQGPFVQGQQWGALSRNARYDDQEQNALVIMILLFFRRAYGRTGTEQYRD